MTQATAPEAPRLDPAQAVVENGVMVAIVLVVALVTASAGFGEVFWPGFLGALAGAIDGMGQRAAWQRRSRANAEPPG